MEYQAVSDEELARLVREEDPDAFAELSARYLWLVRSKAKLFEGPAAPEREDLLQEGFLGLFAAALTFSQQGGASFSTYAGACVRNRMASAARQHGSLKNRPLNESVPLDSAAALAAADSPEDLLEARERARRLWGQAGTALSPLERKALALYLSGCKRGEIPARAGMSLKAFDNALYRVREKLRGL